MLSVHSNDTLVLGSEASNRYANYQSFCFPKAFRIFPAFLPRQNAFCAIFLEILVRLGRLAFFQRQSYERGFFVDVLSQNIKLGPYEFRLGSYIQDRFLRCDSFPNTVEILRKST